MPAHKQLVVSEHERSSEGMTDATWSRKETSRLRKLTKPGIRHVMEARHVINEIQRAFPNKSRFAIWARCKDELAQHPGMRNQNWVIAWSIEQDNRLVQMCEQGFGWYAVTESFPAGDLTKVYGRMKALADVGLFSWLLILCDPDRARLSVQELDGASKYRPWTLQEDAGLRHMLQNSTDPMTDPRSFSGRTDLEKRYRQLCLCQSKFLTEEFNPVTSRQPASYVQTPWTSEEDAMLDCMRGRGHSFFAISSILLTRSLEACSTRWTELSKRTKLQRQELCWLMPSFLPWRTVSAPTMQAAFQAPAPSSRNDELPRQQYAEVEASQTVGDDTDQSSSSVGTSPSDVRGVKREISPEAPLTISHGHLRPFSWHSPPGQKRARRLSNTPSLSSVSIDLDQELLESDNKIRMLEDIMRKRKELAEKNVKIAELEAQIMRSAE